MQIILKRIDATAEEILRTKVCIALAEKAIKSPEFKAFLAETKFTQVKQQPEYEDFLQEITITYKVMNRPWYKRFSSVVGYTIGNDIVTYRNRFWQMSDAELSNHILHEILHAHPFNFSHSVRVTADTLKSVNYAVGDFVQKFCEHSLTVEQGTTAR